MADEMVTAETPKMSPVDIIALIATLTQLITTGMGLYQQINAAIAASDSLTGEDKATMLSNLETLIGQLAIPPTI